jgi:hypothetical protein
MTVLFKELAGSPTETYGPDGLTAQRHLLCAYEDRRAVAAALLGSGSQVGGRSQAGYPGGPGVFAMRVRIEPFEKRPDDQGAFTDLTVDLNNYSNQFAEIVVDYELLDYAGHNKLPHVPTGTILSYRMDFAGEYITLPGQSLQWQSDPTIPVPPDALPTLRIPIVEHHLTWHRVLDPPWDAIRQCAGAVNNADFMGAAAETALFDGARADREFTGLDDSLGPQFGWRVTYVFREKSIKVLDEAGSPQTYGWNHCYRDTLPDPGWDKLVDQSGNSLYQTADFTTLFDFAATT